MLFDQVTRNGETQTEASMMWAGVTVPLPESIEHQGKASGRDPCRG